MLDALLVEKKNIPSEYQSDLNEYIVVKKTGTVVDDEF